MKKYYTLILFFLLIVSCKEQNKSNQDYDINKLADQYCGCYDYVFNEEIEKFTRCQQEVNEKALELYGDDLVNLARQMEICDAKFIDKQMGIEKKEMEKLQRELSDY